MVNTTPLPQKPLFLSITSHAVPIKAKYLSTQASKQPESYAISPGQTSASYQTPQPGIPTAWMMLMTSWAMKVKKKAMKLKELSVLWQRRRFVTWAEALGFPALMNPKLLWA